jgi:hypothetical protein
MILNQATRETSLKTSLATEEMRQQTGVEAITETVSTKS